MDLVKTVFHYFVYLNLITGFLSALYMVFVVYKVKGSKGPMWKHAKEVSHEFFVQRRMYAIEAWIIFGFLSIYFALTSYA